MGIAAYSGTGKTTLLIALLPLLKAAGLRIAVVKHAHHSFDMDHPGKDSYRLRAAGADEMLVAARCRLGWIRECNDQQGEPSLRQALDVLDPERLDLVLVEGFKAEAFPKIELHRAALRKPLLFPHDPHIVAIATDDTKLRADPAGLTRLPINRPGEIADFIVDFIGRGARVQTNLPLER